MLLKAFAQASNTITIGCETGTGEYSAKTQPTKTV